jgi:hypothetical protein
MLDFIQGQPPRTTPIFNGDEIPKEMEIFFKLESEFLPKGKTLADLTPEEIKELQNKYRFSPLRPGLYQTISGFKNSI